MEEGDGHDAELHVAGELGCGAAGWADARHTQAPILVGLPVIPDNAPDEVKDGIAVGNATAVKGVCPSCGATPVFAASDTPGLVTITFLYDLSCPVAQLLNPSEP